MQKESEKAAKTAYNTLQSMEEDITIQEIQSVIENHFPLESVVEDARNELASDDEIKSIEATEKWFKMALPLDQDGYEIHQMIDRYKLEVYEELTGE